MWAVWDYGCGGDRWPDESSIRWSVGWHSDEGCGTQGRVVECQARALATNWQNRKVGDVLRLGENSANSLRAKETLSGKEQ